MPQITFMSWNIENFGDHLPLRGNYNGLCDFIARVAQLQGVDILAIMELKSGGLPHLNTLRAALSTRYNSTWYYDAIKGSFAQGVQNPNGTNSAHLNWDSDHHEGYAVFWNHGKIQDFSMVPTIAARSEGVQGPPPPGALANTLPLGVPPNVLDLVFEGRGLPWQNTAWFNSMPFNQNTQWVPLNFSRSNPASIGVTRFHSVRRPCFFAIQLQQRQAPNNTPANIVVPFLVYHATSNAYSRSLNTQLAGFSRQLYQVQGGNPPGWLNVNNAVIAGDFNVDANKRTAYERGLLAYDAYKVFTNNFPVHGANCNAWLDVNALTNQVPDTPRTTVLLSDGAGQDIPPTGRFIRLAIDNIFYRLGPGVTATVPNNGRVLDLIRAINTPNPNIVQPTTQIPLLPGWYNSVNQMIQGLPIPVQYQQGTGIPLYQGYPILNKIRGRIVNWLHFTTGLANGHFFRVNGNNQQHDNRTAAEFINFGVSDHLPVTISLNFN